jgi:asparagine synthase (glutamine-hydrolysing)
MCGIAGLFRDSGVSAADSEAVARMTRAQQHRGPDAEGIHVDRRAVLGHRRLSILDLSDSGRQPMSNEDGSLTVVYNGEIYNYRELRRELLEAGHVFRSQSDTEVLVHGYEQWGTEGLLRRLRGMFAFALYDTGAGLILARDRLGIKPLYYYLGSDCLLFASEVKALLRSGMVPRESEREALIGFLMAGSVPAPLTTVRGVKCLLAGHYAVYRGGSFRVRQYWGLGCCPAGGRPSELREVLADSVQRHLVSDVPLGVFLSGGVDSAAVVALAARARGNGRTPLQTLTVSFDEAEFSEERHAGQIARHFGTGHQTVRVTAHDFQREIPAFFEAMDQPTNDGVNTYFVSRAARQAGLKVVLSGLGGDEVFWGYSHYRWLRRLGEWLERSPAMLRGAAAGALSTVGRIRGRESWRRASYLSAQASTAGLYLLLRGFFAPEQVASLLGAGRAEVDEVAKKYFAGPRAAASQAAAFNHVEIQRYLHDQLLRDADVFSMAHSIEARVPLLDHEVVECVAGLGASRKLDRAVHKPLLVSAVDDPLVRAAAVRPKRGFSFPMDGWMKRGAGDLEEISRSSGVLNRRSATRCWIDFRHGKLHWSRAWALTVLGGQN